MTNMTLAIPKDLKAIMDKHKEVKWSEVARRGLWDHARKLELMEKLHISWTEISKHPRRKVSAAELKKDLERIEDEV